jgi:cytochrome c
MRARWISLCATVVLIAGPGAARADEALAKKVGCLGCHSVDKKVTGPAYRDVAMKYRRDRSARQKLIEKVKQGGEGNWTAITGGRPMPPHWALLSDAEVARLVDWILSR